MKIEDFSVENYNKIIDIEIVCYDLFLLLDDEWT